MTDFTTRFAIAKSLVMAALQSADIADVEVVYSGSGDEGYINDITALNAERQEIDITTIPGVKTTFGGESSLKETVEELSWALITSKHGGWENNEGGEGTITFDVKTTKVTMSHDENVVTQVNETTEV